MRPSPALERRQRLRLACLLLALLAPAGALAAEFEVTRAEIGEVNGIYMVDAEIDYAFGDEPLEALANGVPLTLSVEVEIKRKRRYVWDERIARVVQVYELKRHELSDRYIVTNVAAATSRDFDSLADAIDALGKIAPIPVLEADKLAPGEDYRVRMRSRLDIEALPAPLRPLAYVHPGWRLGSGWHRWELER